MQIIKLPVGDYQANCYILINNNDCLIIDPGAEGKRIKEITKNYNIKGILVTHYHFDHIGALDDFKEYPIYNYMNCECEITLDNFNFKIIETKGHKSDCVSFLFDLDMFTGDFIFKETIGRTDFEDSNYLEMLDSLEKIKNYDSKIRIHPGHGESSTLDYEFKNNYFLK